MCWTSYTCPLFVLHVTSDHVLFTLIDAQIEKPPKPLSDPENIRGQSDRKAAQIPGYEK